MKELRSFTAKESKQWKELGEVEGLSVICPLFSWCDTPPKKQIEGDIYNSVVLTATEENAIVQLPIDVMVSTREGFLVSIMNAAGVGHDLFFPSDAFDKALNVFNKAVEALKNNNNF